MDTTQKMATQRSETLRMTKLKDDSITSLRYNSSNSAKLREKYAQERDLLQQASDLARGLHSKVADDMPIQESNVRAMHNAVAQSRQVGAVKYNQTPPSDLQHKQYQKFLSGMSRINGEHSVLKNEVSQVEANERETRNTMDIGANSFSAWFQRYGRPRKEPGKGEPMVSHILEPRRTPFSGKSNARTMRTGFLFKNLTHDRFLAPPDSRRRGHDL
eukprot:gnl/MRDRNA2_/MRDRNA2_117165_c0_seq1.p1 gnl/MRDRNA2_/MRDRNA2_117165_c0~~gnl/MRDRNA2_/MRDRNA2_117165_c0_seq1.p1  ORF type:complete len:216 (-),score=36.64 gnl/MRDRNA2_/MRDRNA2_117165_c0_seq1:17-664(-)